MSKYRPSTWKPKTPEQFAKFREKNRRNRIRRKLGMTDEVRISAYDRSGKAYTLEEVREVFRKIYSKSPRAIALLFPNMSAGAINKRARSYGLHKDYDPWRGEEIETLLCLWPDKAAIASATGRTVIAVQRKCEKLKLRRYVRTIAYTVEDDDRLRRGETVPGRTAKSMAYRRSELGISLRAIKSVRALTTTELVARIEPLLSQGYPSDKRKDMIQHVLQECLEGRCSARSEDLKNCAKKAVTAVYKLHPDRGAPMSLDAQIYDDGSTTIGDRISADAFHF